MFKNRLSYILVQHCPYKGPLFHRYMVKPYLSSIKVHPCRLRPNCSDLNSLPPIGSRISFCPLFLLTCIITALITLSLSDLLGATISQNLHISKPHLNLIHLGTVMKLVHSSDSWNIFKVRHESWWLASAFWVGYPGTDLAQTQTEGLFITLTKISNKACWSNTVS